jgi:hypothetical protein
MNTEESKSKDKYKQKSGAYQLHPLICDALQEETSYFIPQEMGERELRKIKFKYL